MLREQSRGEAAGAKDLFELEEARPSSFQNGLWNALATIVGSIGGIVGSIVIIRVLAPAAYGAFSYHMWLASTLGTIGTLGFPEAVTKISSELRGERNLVEANAVGRSILVGLLGVNLLLSLGLAGWSLLTSPADRQFLLVVATFLPTASVAAVMRSILWGREQYRPVAVVAVAASLVQFATIVAATVGDWGALGFVAASLSTSVAYSIGLAVTLRRLGFPFRVPRSILVPSEETRRRYLAFVVPASLGVPLTVIVWERSEVFFLARYGTLEQVGFYSLAYTIFSLTLGLGWALSHGLYPSISRDYGAGDWDRLQSNVQRGLMVACMYAVPLTFGGWATADQLLVLLYGDKMLPSAGILRVLLVGLGPGIAAAVLGFVLTGTTHVWRTFRIGILLAVVNVGLDLILIPRYGGTGGAIANTASQLAFTIILVHSIRRVATLHIPWRGITSIVLVGLLTTYALPLTVQAWLPGLPGLAAGIALGAAFYATSIWLSGYLRIFHASQVA